MVRAFQPDDVSAWGNGQTAVVPAIPGNRDAPAIYVLAAEAAQDTARAVQDRRGGGARSGGGETGYKCSRPAGSGRIEQKVAGI